MIFTHQPNGEPPLGGCDRLHSHHKVPIIQVPKRILIEFQKRILIELQKRILIELRNNQDANSRIRSVRMGDCFLLSIVSFFCFPCSVFYLLFSVLYFWFSFSSVFGFPFLFFVFCCQNICCAFTVLSVFRILFCVSSFHFLCFYLFFVFCILTFCDKSAIF